MPNKEELLRSIQTGMKLDRDFFLKIYGYEISFPGFKQTAIQDLNKAGCSRAEEYYNAVLSEYKRKRDESLRPVIHDYRLRCEEAFNKKVKEFESKRSDELRREEIMKDLLQKSDRELLSLLQSMN